MGASPFLRHVPQPWLRRFNRWHVVYVFSWAFGIDEMKGKLGSAIHLTAQ